MNLFPLRFRTRVTQNSVMHRGVMLYNTLPLDIKTAQTIVTFKAKLKQYLLQNLLVNPII